VIDLLLWTEYQITLREMAEILGVRSPTTPQRYLERAFQKLRDCLAGKGYDPADA
jgi:DNA-directed RNA polymerase specialized sigma24 family protein